MVTHKNILLFTVTHSGDSTGLSTENITGTLWLILTEVIALFVWAGMVAAWTLISCWIPGNHLSVHLTIYNLLFAVTLIRVCHAGEVACQ